MRELMTSLCNDPNYQFRLRSDFRRRRVHPAIESLVWAHTIGKPPDRLQLSADVTMSQKYERERELFLQLPVEQLEALATESQALVDKAFAMARAHGAKLDAATVRGAPVEHGDGRDASGPKTISADVARSGDAGGALSSDCAQARTTPTLVAGSASPTAGVDDVVTSEPVEQSTAVDT
jgi:hypothetical protein